MTTNRNETPHLADLTGPQHAALLALVGGATVTAAAEAAACDRSTVSNWLNHDLCFRSALEHGRAELWGCHLDRARQLLGRALDCLNGLLEDDAAPQGLRLRAATAVLGASGLTAGGLDPGQPRSPDDIKMDDKAKLMERFFRAMKTMPRDDDVDLEDEAA